MRPTAESLARNAVRHWQPLLVRSGVPTPVTWHVRGLPDYGELLTVAEADAGRPARLSDDVARFLARINAVAERLPSPFILRTGHTACKWYWRQTCYVPHRRDLRQRICRLAFESELMHVMGLPADDWALRELIPATPLFHAFDGRMPIVREFRSFFRDGRCTCIHPMWPADAIRDPTSSKWRAALERANRLSGYERRVLRGSTETVAGHFEGDWSIDWLQSICGTWYAIDMHNYEDAWHWPGCQHAPREAGA